MASRGRVMLTGANGFTGRYVREALRAAGYQVVGLVQHGPTVADEAIVNLTDPATLREVVARVRPDYVLHLAAIAFVEHQDAEQFYHVNLFGTLNLLDALIAEQIAVRKVVLASSANVYGNVLASPVSEQTRPAPANHYAMSKLAMEHMALTRLDKLPVAIARPFNYTGVGQSVDFLIPKIVAHFQRGEPVIRLGNLEVEREFNDVRAVAQAYVALLDRLPAGEVVNICSGRGHRLLDVIDVLRQLSGHWIGVEVDPDLVRPSEVRRLVGDPARLHAVAGALPELSLQQTLGWMLGAV